MLLTSTRRSANEGSSTSAAASGVASADKASGHLVYLRAHTVQVGLRPPMLVFEL